MYVGNRVQYMRVNVHVSHYVKGLFSLCFLTQLVSIILFCLTNLHNMLYSVQYVCTENPVIFAEILKLQVNATWPNLANWSKLPKFNYVLGGPVNTKT